MSTRSRIAVVLKEDDLNKLMMPQANLLYGKLNHEDSGKEGVIDLPMLHSSSFEHPVVSIYHHWDGYPTGVGVTLMNHYDDYEKAVNLMLFGDASTINADSENDTIEFYNYWRNDDWTSVMPMNFKNINELKTSVRNGWEEYLYIYKPNEKGEYEWLVSPVGKRMAFRKLSDVLDEEFEK